MHVGASWDTAYELNTNLKVKITGNLKANVVGYEKITVPAGTFDAWKLEYIGYFKRSDYPASAGGVVMQTYWYAPAMKRIILAEYSDSSGGKVYSRSRTTLVSYRFSDDAVPGAHASTECGADLLCSTSKVRPALGAIIK
jgi:hypothetical protein